VSKVLPGLEELLTKLEGTQEYERTAFIKHFRELTDVDLSTLTDSGVVSVWRAVEALTAAYDHSGQELGSMASGIYHGALLTVTDEMALAPNGDSWHKVFNDLVN
jgi:hypothetical protein